MYRKAIGSGVLAIALAACGGGDEELATLDVPMDTAATPMPAAAETPMQARAVLQDPSGAEVGTATFTQQGNGVRISVQLSSVAEGAHGFHIHQVGACDAPGFDSAGGHYNPTNASHGFEDPAGPHAGDMQNLEVGADGTVTTEITNDMVTLAPGQPNSLMDADGSALVLHAGPDDYTTQPSGDSGARVACGIVEAA